MKRVKRFVRNFAGVENSAIASYSVDHKLNVADNRL